MTEGYLNSSDLVEKISMLHRRKGEIKTHMIAEEIKLSTLIGEERKIHVTILSNYKSELARIGELLKEFSLLLKNSIDNILIVELKKSYPEIYSELEQRAKEIYGNLR